MDRTVLAMVASLVVLALLIFNLLPNRPNLQPANGPAATGKKPQPLMIYCAVSNKSVIEAIRRDYEREFQVPLEIQYGPSQTLMASLAVSKAGDFVLAGRRQLSGNRPRTAVNRRRVSAREKVGRRGRRQRKPAAN